MERVRPASESALPIGAGSRDSRGFALIIVVALLALLVLVLVSLATLTRIETAIGANTLSAAKARQNARYAMEIAIGELQRHAGPDQRSTAESGIVLGVVQTHWTGVWSQGVLQTWLVSGNENMAPGGGSSEPTDEVSVLDSSLTVDDPVTINGAPAVTLVGPRSAGSQAAGYVLARRMELRGSAPDGTADAVLGHYAWWVGDEGVKAFVADRDMVNDVTFAPYDVAASRERLRQLMQPRVRIEPVFGLADGWYSGSTEDDLEKVIFLRQLSFVSGGPGMAATANRFHDITVASRGLVVDAANGGLKYDLSGLETDTGAPSPIDRYLNFINLEPDSTLVSGAYVETESPSANDAVIRPVLSAAWVQMKVRLPPVGPAGQSPVVERILTVELWNPYNVPLQAKAHRIRVDGLPRVVLSMGSWNGDLAWDAGTRTAFDLLGGTMQPGEVVQLQKVLGPVVEPVVPEITEESEFRLERGESTLEVTLRYNSEQVISTYSATVPFASRAGMGAAAESHAVVGYRLKDDVRSWLRSFDPRSSAIATAASSSIVGLSSSPPVVQGSVLGVAGMPRCAVFDLPEAAPSDGAAHVLSLGVLAHMSIPGRGAYSIGGVPGGAENTFFDRFFLSTLPPSAVTDWNPAVRMPLPNTHLEVWPGMPLVPLSAGSIINLDRDTRASAFLVRGAFNVNSTSEFAWRAFISGTRIAAWRYWNGTAEDSVTVDRAFFRLPRSSSYVGADATTASPWALPFRSLSLAQVTDLAGRVAAKVESKGPFASLEAFLNSGALQEALDESNINMAGLPELTQADLVQAWAPLLTVRSDTFTIRAYGETVNPVTGGTEARAWCEAVVQRIPEYVDPTENNPWDPPAALGANTLNGRFGRRFVITSFRWLSPDDI